MYTNPEISKIIPGFRWEISGLVYKCYRFEIYDGISVSLYQRLVVLHLQVVSGGGAVQAIHSVYNIAVH